MAEALLERFAFNDEAIVIEVFYDDVTGHPTRVTSDNRSGASQAIAYTLANRNRSFTGTHTVPVGGEEFTVPTNLANRIDVLSGDVSLEATWQR